MFSLLFKSKKKHGDQPNKLGGKIETNDGKKGTFTSSDYLAFAEIANNIYIESQKYEAARAQAATENANNQRQKLMIEVGVTRQLQERQNNLNAAIARRSTKEFKTAANMKQMRQLTVNAEFNRSAAQLDYRPSNTQQLAAISAKTDFLTSTHDEFRQGIGLFKRKLELDVKEQEKQVASDTGGGVIKTNDSVKGSI